MLDRFCCSALVGALFFGAIIEGAEIEEIQQGNGHSNEKSAEIVVDLGHGVKMEFVRIKAGRFPMGSRDLDRPSYYDEKPRHEVTITHDFLMGKYPVTQEQYQAVTGKNPSCFSSSGWGKDRIKGLNTQVFPVEDVTWNDAKSFCDQLTSKDTKGRRFELPTEAQWEYACRAGTQTQYYFGDSDSELNSYGWYLANSDKRSHAVGTKKPNAWGLYDMTGNVWQWCEDWYRDSFYSKSEKEDPLCQEETGNHAYRGGSWYDDSDGCRASARGNGGTRFRSSLIGFRVSVKLNKE